MEAVLFPLPAPPEDGIYGALALLFAFAIGHAVADFPLQGDFIARGKNRHTPHPPLADGGEDRSRIWIYLMAAHCLIHAGFVWAISGLFVLALAEFVLHFVIDVFKCEGITSFAVDQWLHLLSKVAYVALIWAGLFG